LACSKQSAQFKSMEVRNSQFTAFVDVFTPNTFVMVVMSDESIESAATKLNIQMARNHFEKFIQQGNPSAKSILYY